MIRILYIAIFFAILYFVFKMILKFINSFNCANCQGLGYWEGTRGDRNTCKVCDGTGKNK